MFKNGELAPFAVVGDEGQSLVEALAIQDDAVNRAVGILAKRPPFNGDPRIGELQFKDYLSAQLSALAASGIGGALAQHFDRLQVDQIAVGARGALALRFTEEFVEKDGESVSVLSDPVLHNALEQTVGPHATIINRPIDIPNI